MSFLAPWAIILVLNIQYVRSQDCVCVAVRVVFVEGSPKYFS